MQVLGQQETWPLELVGVSIGTALEEACLAAFSIMPPIHEQLVQANPGPHLPGTPKSKSSSSPNQTPIFCMGQNLRKEAKPR